MTTRVAVAQVGTRLFDPEATLEKCKKFVAEAANGGARLVVFPEAFFGGYPKGLDFGAVLGIRTPEGRELFQAYYDCAIQVPGPVTEQLSQLAQETGISLLTGVIERVGGTLYCATLCFDNKGELIQHHRKLMPTALERVIWGCGDGSGLKVAQTEIGKIGALICWENYMPLARMALYQGGVEIYCTPTVDDREAWIPTLRHIAREGRCFVLSACQYLTREDYPSAILAQARHLPELPIRGGSCIVGPLGDIIAGPLYEREGLVYADLDMKEITRGKYDLDVVGHYARPDVFEFRVKS